MIEWLERRGYNQHVPASKPTRAILLCPWKEDFVAISPAWRFWQAVLNFSHNFMKLVVIVWKSIQTGSDTNRTGAEGLSFYYPRLLCFPDQMLAMIVLSQHWVFLFKTVKSHVPCSA